MNDCIIDINCFEIETCVICLDNLDKSKYYKCHKCIIKYHKSCIIDMIHTCSRFDSCPHCRQEIKTPKDLVNEIKKRRHPPKSCCSRMWYFFDECLGNLMETMT